MASAILAVRVRVILREINQESSKRPTLNSESFREQAVQHPTSNAEGCPPWGRRRAASLPLTIHRSLGTPALNPQLSAGRRLANSQLSTFLPLIIMPGAICCPRQLGHIREERRRLANEESHAR